LHGYSEKDLSSGIAATLWLLQRQFISERHSRVIISAL